MVLESGRSRYRATAGCNGLGGAYVLDEEKKTLTLQPGISTLMAHPIPTSPSRSVSGARTSVRNTSLKWWSVPSAWRMGLSSAPFPRPCPGQSMTCC